MTFICSFCENEAVWHLGTPKTINFCEDHSGWIKDKKTRQRGMKQIDDWCKQTGSRRKSEYSNRT